MADVTSFENVPLENGNHVPRSSPAILGNKKTLGTRVRKLIFPPPPITFLMVRPLTCRMFLLGGGGEGGMGLIHHRGNYEN